MDQVSSHDAGDVSGSGSRFRTLSQARASLPTAHDGRILNAEACSISFATLGDLGGGIGLWPKLPEVKPPERIETDRLILCPATLDDAGAVFAYHRDAEVTRYLTFPRTDGPGHR